VKPEPSSPEQAPPPIAAPQPLAPQAGPVLQAQALFAGRSWVGIEHNGQHYRLQTTRAGKLILTK
jgi:hemin uptake protein HemP